MRSEIMRSMTSLQAGACMRPEVDPELFFDDDSHTPAQQRAARDRAIAICRRCPVLDECLDFATDPRNAQQTSHGVWGATTAIRRGKLREHRRLGLAERRPSIARQIPAQRTALAR